MEARAILRYHRGSVRKARLILDLIRGVAVPEAQKILMFSTKRVAAPIGKLLDSAVANAQQKDNRVDVSQLVVADAFGDDGPIMKRFQARAQGRAFVIRRRTCHVTLVLREKE
ncbi:MAG: 50S ribosomal protein L22 [Candidatus Zophobacter franzmannii]|jgi:large subunit ribosomal protein L22|nr:50S ribosomal protein L22 [Candidatus Zophobacter franzmannii]